MCLSRENTRHFEGAGMRGRGEIASAHDLTPEKVPVTWLREEAEVAVASQEEPGNVCIELSCFGICVTQNLGENILPLSRACFSLSLQILKHRNTQTLSPEASVPTMGGAVGLDTSKDIRAGQAKEVGATWCC